MQLPAQYTAARRALIDAKHIYEVKEVRNKAVAMEVYAFQAKDADLMQTATEIKRLATRRIGQMMAAMREAGELKHGGDHKSKVGRRPLKLKDQGVDKHLADHARKFAAMSDAKFATETAKAIKIAVAAALANKEVITAARAERHEKKSKARKKRMKQLAAKIAVLPRKKYAVIYADPEWKWEAWSKKGLDATSADNHYITRVVDEIKERDVESIAADDAVLFLWSTVPMLPQALEVMQAWGFKYVSNFCWDKIKAGTGYWNRNQHETLLIGKRGKIPAPLEGTQFPSLLSIRATKHSKKPDKFREIIDAYFPDLPKIELNYRGKPPPNWDWDTWGNEVEPMLEAAE
jgi:N6-adenosine-specific RNA methylase IME4